MGDWPPVGGQAGLGSGWCGRRSRRQGAWVPCTEDSWLATRLDLVAPGGPGGGEAVQEEHEGLAAARAVHGHVQPAQAGRGRRGRLVAGVVTESGSLISPAALFFQKQSGTAQVAQGIPAHAAPAGRHPLDAGVVHRQVLHAGQGVGEALLAAVHPAAVAHGAAAGRGGRRIAAVR